MSIVNGPRDDSAKVADTARSPLVVTEQPALPVQAPSHPVKNEPGDAAAVSATDSAATNGALQTAPQSIPTGALVTVPLPLPCFTTVSVVAARPSAFATSSVP